MHSYLGARSKSAFTLSLCLYVCSQGKIWFSVLHYSVYIMQEPEECRFILIAGQPLNEPVVQYGMYISVKAFRIIPEFRIFRLTF